MDSNQGVVLFLTVYSGPSIGGRSGHILDNYALVAVASLQAGFQTVILRVQDLGVQSLGFCVRRSAGFQFTAKACCAMQMLKAASATIMISSTLVHGASSRRHVRAQGSCTPRTETLNSIHNGKLEGLSRPPKRNLQNPKP